MTETERRDAEAWHQETLKLIRAGSTPRNGENRTDPKRFYSSGKDDE